MGEWAGRTLQTNWLLSYFCAAWHLNHSLWSKLHQYQSELLQLHCWTVLSPLWVMFPSIIATYIKNLEEQAIVDWKVAAQCKNLQFLVILHYITLIYITEITVPGLNIINYHTIHTAVVTFPSSELVKARICLLSWKNSSLLLTYMSAYFHPWKTKWYGLNLFSPTPPYGEIVCHYRM